MMKLNEKAFAHAVGVVTFVVYLVFYVLLTIAPQSFAYIFNAQFLGADVTSLLPMDMPYEMFITSGVAAIITAWVAGYLVAHIYNMMLKKGKR